MIFNNLNYIISSPRIVKKILAMFTDVILCSLTVWLAFYLRTGSFINFSHQLFLVTAISIFIAIPIFFLFKLYSVIFRYSGWSILIQITRSIIIYGLVFASIITFYGINGVPRTVGLIQPFLLLVFLSSSRIIIFLWLNKNLNDSEKKNRALIYGAGVAGQQLLSSFSHSNQIKILGFLDDDEKLHGNIINNKKIYDPNKLDFLVKDKKITQILLAIPSVSRHKRNQIISKITKKKLIIRTVPSLIDLANGNVKFSDLRDYEINDLLEREIVEPNYNMLIKNVNKKTVLITGAGGSIGGEIARQVINLKPKKLLLLEHNEYSLYKIKLELNNIFKYLKKEDHLTIIPILGSLQDASFVNNVLNTYKPDTIYHAAAYKHVSIVEENIIEGIKNNIFGSLNIIHSSINHNVSTLVLVSTDKAVRPTNIMGASKRFAEICLQSLQDYNDNLKYKNSTVMCMVRFGNALDSSGSVIPLFKKQIIEGGPITLTNKNVTRYFMTIPEAAQLVLQAGSMAKGGDVFVLDMEKPIKIIDLAKRMIQLSGLTVKDKNNLNGDIEINEIGLSKGEKLNEELLLGDNPQPTYHKKIMKAQDPFIKWSELKIIIQQLQDRLNNNEENEVIKILKKIVSMKE